MATNKNDDLYKDAEIFSQFINQSRIAKRDPRKLIEKLYQQNLGLPAENEFAALALWSGKCRYLHRLDKNKLPRDCSYKIPDFLCIFDIKGKNIPVLIEVKSSKNSVRKFTKKYCSALTEFAELMGLPILIAFKYRFANPFWVLFELKNMLNADGVGKADLLEVIKNDLSSIILGTFNFKIKKGVALGLRITKEEILERNESNEIVSFKGKVEDVFWETPEGKRIDWIPLLDKLFMLTQDDVKVEEHESHIVQKFYKVGDDAALSYWALVLAFGMDYFREEAVPWDKLINSQEFHFSINDLEQTVRKAHQFGLADPVIHIQPKRIPEFMVGK
jgi:Holliday junction resolvase